MTQPLSFKQGIVRIFDTNQQNVVGGGMLTSQRRILTCAHVVQSALGVLDTQRNEIGIGKILWLDFPFLDQLPNAVAASISLIDWTHDVAVLNLPEAVAITQEPQPFAGLENGQMPPVLRHRFRALGFPLGEKDGAWAEGKLIDSIANGRYQIEGEGVTGKAVEKGFSGTPVWNEKLGAVAGLLTHASNDKSERVAYMIPVNLLKMIVPDLPTALTTTDKVYAARQAYLQRCIDELADKVEEELEAKFVKLTLMITEGKGKQATPSADQNASYEDLAELVADRGEREQVLILLGAPGSGKTVLLERMRLQAARAAQVDAQQPIPFFVRLNRYQGEDVDPFDWIKERWADQDETLTNILPLEKLLNAGNLLLLLDGLNEIPHADHREFRRKSQKWSRFLDNKLRSSRVLFSCRTNDYSARFDEQCRLNIQQVQVEPLSEEKIIDFLQAYKPKQAEIVWDQIKDDRQQIALYATPFFLKILIEQLDDSGFVPRGRAGLITGFIRRALFRELVTRDNRFLETSGLLSHLDIEEIEDKSWGTSPYALPEEGPLIPALTQLAYQMQTGVGSDGGVVSLPKKEAIDLLPSAYADALVKVGIQLNILAQEKGEKGYQLRFDHQLFQEYFAARRLAENLELELELELVKVEHRSDFVSPTYLEEINELDSGMPISALPTTGWEETMILAAGIVSDPDALTQELMPLNLPLAGRCALSAEVDLSEGVKQDLTQALLNRMIDEEYDVRSRMNAGLVLGELGDPRFKGYGDYLLPPFVEVPAGSYRIGDDNGLYADEKPANDVELEPFKIAVYPVTNGEYKKFIDAGGYEDEQWWDTPAARAWLSGESTAEGGRRTWERERAFLKSKSEDEIRNFSGTQKNKEDWIVIRNWNDEEFENWLEELYPSGITYREPSQWENSRFNGPNQPVVGATWFEARAYCKWLSSASDQIIDLPSEAEWEAAARFNRPDSYPYGNDYLIHGGNTIESHLLQPTPVGIFPAGKTLEGTWDMSGNMYEWTISLWGEELGTPEYKYPYREKLGERENLEAGDEIRRVVRGGSWSSNNRFARSSSRDRHNPSLRVSYIGFRLIVRPPSQDPL